MSDFIIGTAGHIDHGKTTLIKALTGHETDRLEEEKERGISIELGFTYFDLPNGKKAGMVDVPGHERFLKNMLAGVSGMDMVMLVIAADEGIMKQTKEHLDILNMLELHQGIIVITKKDLVDEDWLELVIEDIKESMEGSFLDGAPIISVDSVTGEGIEKVKQELVRISETIEAKSTAGVPRLPVDRIFTITGFGTIVTGTLNAGTFKIGDEVVIYPKEISSKIRSIQVHGEPSNEARAGQRVALNLTNVKKKEIERGDVIAPPRSFVTTMMLDVRVNLLKDSPRIIQNRTRLRLYHGSREILCRAIVLDGEHIGPGEEGLVQLRLEEEIIAKKDDHFILRFYSPMETIGGGVIIEPNPPKRKRFDEEILEEIRLLEIGDAKEVLLNKINQNKFYFVTAKQLSIELGKTEKDLQLELQELLDNIEIKKFKVYGENYYISEKTHIKLEESLKLHLVDFHGMYPLRFGISKEEIRSKFFQNVNANVFDEFIQSLENEKIIKMQNKNMSLYDFKINYDEASMNIRNEIEKSFEKEGYSPINSYEILEAYGDKQQSLVNEIYNLLLLEEILVKVSNIITYHKNYYNSALEFLKTYILENEEISMAVFRDHLGVSRKYAVALLEYFDQQKITIRTGETRKLIKTANE